MFDDPMQGVRNAIMEVCAGQAAIMELLILKGIVTEDELAASKAKMLALLDQEAAKQRTEALRKFDE